MPGYSKWAKDIDTEMKNIKKVKEATREVIKKGGKLALEEYHDAKSLKKLKQLIKEGK